MTTSSTRNWQCRRNQRKMPMVQLLPELAMESFRAWQEHQSKIAY